MKILHTNQKRNLLSERFKRKVYSDCLKIIRSLGRYLDEKMKDVSFIFKRSVITREKDHNIYPRSPYLTDGLSNGKNIDKLISNEKRLSRGQKNDILDWIENEYTPTHFLTIQLPEHKKSENYGQSLNHLRIIMSSVERKLLGRHWNKKHLPFICFAEHGMSVAWHFHILFNNHNFTDEQIGEVISQVGLRLGLSDYCMRLEKIYSSGAISYCIKEIKVFYNNKIDTERIILSHNLFNVACKNSTNLISDVKKVGKDKS